MSGYSAPYIGLPDPEKKPVENMETSLSQSTLTKRGGKSWYKKLSLSARSIGRSGRFSIISDSSDSQARNREEYLNKPLPPLPCPQPPYFEYMFADAGIKTKKSNETEKSFFTADGNTQEVARSEAQQTSSIASNASAQSYGFDTSEMTQFAFAHAGVNVSTKETIDNHFASLGTSLEGRLHLDNLAEDFEKEKATEDFFGGVKVKESPTPNHVPVVDGEGFVDRREGLEEWPQLWRPDKEIHFCVPHSKTPEHSNIVGQKHILQPKSQKNKHHSPAVQPVRSPVRAPAPLTIRKKSKSPNRNHNRHGTQSYRVNKRAARDSFVTKSTVVNGAKPDDYNINLVRIKKTRVTETLVDQDINGPSRAVSVCGSISSSSTLDLTINSTSSDTSLTPASPLDRDTDSVLSLKRKRLTGSLTGYPGQFESYEADYLRVRATLGPLHTFTTGDPLHPNNVFTHKNFVADPTFPAMDYTKQMLDGLPVRSLALAHAENMTDSYSSSQQITSVRTPTQEMLRREVHRECAAARLEGVSAGEYRYYQGFMSLEDYVAARMCVCWGFCWCSKLCSIYGDVLCPCSEWIEVHGDDD